MYKSHLPKNFLEIDSLSVEIPSFGAKEWYKIIPIIFLIGLSLWTNMKRLLITPTFKRFKKSYFFSSLNQNTCPVYNAEEIKKQEQKEAIKKLYP